MNALVVADGPPEPVPTLSEGLTFEAWRMVGADIWSRQQSLMWAIGDWMRFGDGRFEGAYEEAEKITGLSRATLKQAKYVAGAYEASRRLHDISWSHHQAAASLPVLERDDALRTAAASGLTLSAFRDDLARRRREFLGDTQPLAVTEAPPVISPAFDYALHCLTHLVAAVFELEPDAFTGEEKGSADRVHARQVLFYLLNTEAGFHQVEIAEALGRHRSTVGHAIEVMTGIRDGDPDIDRAFSDLGEMYRRLQEARERVPQLVEALAP